MIMKPLALRNNNPLNIRYSPMNDWLGQTGCNKGFCTFDTIEHGWRAAMVLLSNYVRKGYDTIPEIIARWAPRSENSTEAYISYCLCNFRFEHYDPTTRLTHHYELARLALTMAEFETGLKDLQKEDVDILWTIEDKYKLPKLQK